MQDNKWAPAVVLVDAAYLDRVAEGPEFIDADIAQGGVE